MQKLENISVRVLQVLGIVLFALLTVTSLIFTRFFQLDYQSEIPYNQVDFFLLTLLGTLILAGLSIWLGSRVVSGEEKAERNLKLLLAVVLCWMLAAGLIWIGLANSTPVSDQNMIWKIPVLLSVPAGTYGLGVCDTAHIWGRELPGASGI